MAVAVVALEDDDGVFTETVLAKGGEELADGFVVGGDKGGIEIARVGEIFVMLQPFGVALVWVMRRIIPKDLLP